MTGDNESMGVASANYIVEKIGTTGTVVARPVPTSGSVSELRMKGFTDTMAEIAPDVEIIKYAPPFTRGDGLKAMANTLTANPQTDAVTALADETPTATLQATTEPGLRYALSMLTVLPILLVYPFMQKYFVKGIMLGAVKG